MTTRDNFVRAALPRITIEFCTQCRWMLRAAYFAQEIMSTFGLSIGEVALQPSTGGKFIITMDYIEATESSARAEQSSNLDPLARADSSRPGSSSADPYPSTSSSSNPSEPDTARPDPRQPPTILSTTLWDRATDGGFPETKILKRRIRDVIDPARNLGHVDRQHAARGPAKAAAEGAAGAGSAEAAALEGDALRGTGGASGSGAEAAAPTPSRDAPPTAAHSSEDVSAAQSTEHASSAAHWTEHPASAQQSSRERREGQGFKAEICEDCA